MSKYRKQIISLYDFVNYVPTEIMLFSTILIPLVPKKRLVTVKLVFDKKTEVFVKMSKRRKLKTRELFNLLNGD